jgi:hypothetical protein
MTGQGAQPAFPRPLEILGIRGGSFVLRVLPDLLRQKGFHVVHVKSLCPQHMGEDNLFAAQNFELFCTGNYIVPIDERSVDRTIFSNMAVSPDGLVYLKQAHQLLHFILEIKIF